MEDLRCDETKDRVGPRGLREGSSFTLARNMTSPHNNTMIHGGLPGLAMTNFHSLGKPGGGPRRLDQETIGRLRNRGLRHETRRHCAKGAIPGFPHGPERGSHDVFDSF